MQDDFNTAVDEQSDLFTAAVDAIAAQQNDFLQQQEELGIANFYKNSIYDLEALGDFF